MKSPLRYPGGKSRAAKYIATFVPNDAKEFCSPFMGGGSIELMIASRGTKVYGYDIFQPLICFWKHLLKSPMALATLADTYRTPLDGNKGLKRNDFLRLKRDLCEVPATTLTHAAKFYALNRS